MWPFRATIPLSAALFMIQGVSEVLKCWYQIQFGREFEHKEKIEIMTGLELLGLVMLLVMLGAIFIGLPISFTLLFLAGVVRLHRCMGERVLSLAYLQTIGIMKQDELVAVPMFILMGFICDEAGLMERLFRAFRDLFAPLKGRALRGRHPHRDAVRHRGRDRGRDGDAAWHHGRAHDDPRRLRCAHVGGLDRGWRHARHPDSAVGDAGRDGARARHLDHRPLRGRIWSGLSAVGHVHRLHPDPLSLQSEARSTGACRGAAG